MCKVACMDPWGQTFKLKIIMIITMINRKFRNLFVGVRHGVFLQSHCCSKMVDYFQQGKGGTFNIVVR